MELNGKWKYREDYGYGVTEGELVLTQEGRELKGRIIFTDKVDGEQGYMIQEFLTGEIDGLKVRLEAREFDIIHSDYEINYELDSWFGILVDEITIKGISEDGQGVEGIFTFEKVEN